MLKPILNIHPQEKKKKNSNLNPRGKQQLGQIKPRKTQEKQNQILTKTPKGMLFGWF